MRVRWAVWGLAVEACDCTLTAIISTEISRTALELAPEDRLELARRLVESVVEPVPLNEAVKAGIRRIEDVATGRVAGMSEEQYRAALA